MPRMPGALWRPLPHTGQRMTGHDILCYHTAVGSLDGTDSYFRSMAPGGTASHFGVGYDGTIYQWVDTDYWAWANYAGSGHIISVETADVGTGFPKWNTNDGSAVPAWTAAQVEALAEIAAWVSKAHDIPLTLIPDSKPGRRGIGYHRQGVPGYMVAGGEQWSRATGKVCPGARRIAQIPQVITRAKQLAAPAPVPEDEVTDADIQKIVAELRKADFSPAAGTQSLQNMISQVHSALTAKVDRIASDAGGPAEGDVVPVSRAKMIEYVDVRTRRLEAAVAEVLALLQGGNDEPPAAA